MPPKKSSSTNLEEIKALTEVREMVAEEVDAKANLLQARSLQQHTFWMKWMTIGTFLMAFMTFLLAVLPLIVKP